MIAKWDQPLGTSNHVGNSGSSRTGCHQTHVNAPARVRRIFESDIEFIPNPLFLAPDAERVILESPRERVRSATTDRKENLPAPAGASPYLAALYKTRLLSADEERSLFRRMNYLKHCAARLREELDPYEPDMHTVQRIESLLAEGKRIRDEIIHANLRLVVSIAKRFVDGTNRLHELVSSGNWTLMRAVEKFDFARGFRFSTYATWALRREFYRVVARSHRDQSVFVTGKERLFALMPDQRMRGGSPRTRERLRSRLDRMLAELPDRERLIISARHGLDDGGRPQSLQKIGDKLGLCKERVRQLQARALEKLQVLARREQLEPPPD